MTILAIDVGNTRAKLGIWHSLNPTGKSPDQLTAVPLAGDVDLPEQVKIWLQQVGGLSIEQVIIAGSNPKPVAELMASWLADDFPINQIQSHQQIPLKMDVKNPETVGIDRLLTAVAVRSRQHQRTPVIVVDAGTATTVNLTTADGVFRGGAILPGMRMSAQALHDYTAVLPHIDADTFVEHEDANSKTDQCAVQQSTVTLKMPGRDTKSAIQNGIFWGHLGSIKELISQLTNHLVATEAPVSELTIAVTGGGGRQLATLIPAATYEDSLALIGLSTLAASSQA